MTPLSDLVAQILARHRPAAGTPVVDEDDDLETFDPRAWRIKTYKDILDRETPIEFANARPTHPDVVAWVRARVEGQPTSPALLIAGEPGVGKTWQAWGALRELVLAAARANRRCRWRAVSHPVLNDLLRPKPDQSHAYALDVYLEADLLLLDDLGAGRQTDWTGDALLRLVDHRWSHRLPTIYTTNLSKEQLRDASDERVLSRLRDSARVLMTGPDLRGGAR